jgi:hypothetical protein
MTIYNLGEQTNMEIKIHKIGAYFSSYVIHDFGPGITFQILCTASTLFFLFT